MKILVGNYKKCEIINKYGYGVVIAVENTLFTAYGFQNELIELINELYINSSK